jgi:hypothetical protein
MVPKWVILDLVQAMHFSPTRFELFLQMGPLRCVYRATRCGEPLIAPALGRGPANGTVGL